MHCLFDVKTGANRPPSPQNQIDGADQISRKHRCGLIELEDRRECVIPRNLV